MTRQIKTAPFTVKSADESEGVIERIVSVFGNVDYGGDRVVVGAFSDTIERWKNSGDPIPVVFSHDWSNLDAHLGVVDDLKELPPGDPLLPDEIKDNGGLWVREKYDMHVPAAARAFELQARRSLKESSFAYTVTQEQRAKGGVNELLAVDLIEVGPCLKGMNPATQLLAAKSIDPANVPEHHPGGLVPGDPGEVTVKAGEFVIPTGHPSDLGDAQSKALVTLDGSYEKLIEDLAGQLGPWSQLNFPDDDWWYVGIEATYPDSVVVYLEAWSDPYGKGQYQQAPYSTDEHGQLVIGAPQLVAISGNIVPKALQPAADKLRGKASRSGSSPEDTAEPGGLTPASFLAVADLELAALTPTEERN